MKDSKEYNSVRVAVASALIALSVGLLTILHEKEKILGLFLVGGGFVIGVYNSFIVLLVLEIILGTVFLLSTGYVYGFKEEKHIIAKRIQKCFYSWSLGLFPVACLSVLYNAIIKIFGIDSMMGINVAVLLSSLIALIFIILVFGKIIWRNKHPKRDKNDRC